MPKVDDLVRLARLEQIADETVVTRTFRVFGITDTASGVLFNALDFPGIPAIGDAYPGGTNPYRVRSKRVRPDGVGDACLVVVTYSNKTGETWNQAVPESPDVFGQDVKQFSSTLADFTTTVTSEVSPAPMLITPPASASDVPYLSVAKIKRPVGTLVFERTETVPPPASRRNLVGTVNSADLPLAAPVFGPGSLLFTGLSTRSVDGGRVWRVTYEFAFSSQGWRHRDRYVGPDGKTAQDSVELSWPIYEEFDFASLGLDFSDDQTPLP